VDRELGKERTGGQPGQQRLATDVISPLAWPVSRVTGTIGPDEVHLWAWAFPPDAANVSADTAVLDRQERERMSRFHFAPDRERYAVAHANVRRILGTYLNQPPEKICFRANRFGKPELAADVSLSFSMSHCRTIAIVAVANG
jgi:4'-phosphopantetheinyl transferase